MILTNEALTPHEKMCERMWTEFKRDGLAVLEIGFPQRLPMACERCVFGSGKHNCGRGE